MSVVHKYPMVAPVFGSNTCLVHSLSGWWGHQFVVISQKESTLCGVFRTFVGSWPNKCLNQFPTYTDWMWHTQVTFSCVSCYASTPDRCLLDQTCNIAHCATTADPAASYVNHNRTSLISSLTHITTRLSLCCCRSQCGFRISGSALGCGFCRICMAIVICVCTRMSGFLYGFNSRVYLYKHKILHEVPTYRNICWKIIFSLRLTFWRWGDTFGNANHHYKQMLIFTLSVENI